MKRKEGPIILSLLCSLGALSAASYATGPTTETFNWNSLNPFDFFSGTAFTLSFGFGVPIILSVIICFALFCLMWWLFYKVIRFIFGKI